MARSLEFRRRSIIGSAVLLSAAPALVSAAPALAGPRQAPPKTKASDATITATERLMRNNGVLMRVLVIYDAGIRRLGQDEDIEPSVFIQTGEIMRDFVHAYHEKAEEEQVFPHFKKAGRMVPLVEVLQAQHQAGQKLTERILQTAESARTSKTDRTAMIEAMQASCTLYRPHMARETTDLLPTLRSLVTPAEFDEIGEALVKREVALFGADGLEKVAKRVEALEKRIGIHDLSQFNPKS